MSNSDDFPQQQTSDAPAVHQSKREAIDTAYGRIDSHPETVSALQQKLADAQAVLQARLTPQGDVQIQRAGTFTRDEAAALIRAQLDLDAPAQQNAEVVATPSIVQVEAAKLRLVTDKRLGKQTPEWVTRVAKGLPSQPATAAG